MEIHHNIDQYILFIIIMTLVTIIGFIGISIPAYEQQKIIDASPTMGIILLIFTGVILVIYVYLEIKNEDKTYNTISPTA